MYGSRTRFALLVALAMAMAMGARPALAGDGTCTGVGSHLIATSARNASGHVVTTVRFAQETLLPAAAATVALDVRPTATRCHGNVRTDVLTITLQMPPPLPGQGYEEFPGFGYYKLHEELKTWDEAKVACESEGAHLLVLNSEAEAITIQKLIKRHPKIGSTWIFIGFHDRDKEGFYATIFGDELTTTGYAKWIQSQPDNAGNNENCGTVHYNIIGLNDYPCNKKIPFICEQF